MYLFKLLYQSLILVAVYRCGLCERYDYHLDVEHILVDGIQTQFGPTRLSKLSNSSRFTFSADANLNAACGGSFKTSYVEIMNVFRGEMRFTITRAASSRLQYHVKCTFPSTPDLQRFFLAIRLQQTNQYSEQIQVKSMFTYPRNNPQISDPTQIQPFVNNDVFYVKSMDSEWFAFPKSFNFVSTNDAGDEVRADLVFPSSTFNISSKIGDDKYVLCVRGIQNVFILLFPDESDANKFNESVNDDLDTNIACSNDWLTDELIQQLDTL